MTDVSLAESAGQAGGIRVIIGDARRMAEVESRSVGLIVTSPPYWHIKNYGVPGQIGYGQSLHEYLHDLARVWAECARVLQPGRRLCINIGDQFARASVYGRYQVIPLHAEVIAQCAAAGLDFLGTIIWQKKTTMQTSGGAVIMGSYPHPPNGIVELDHEYILLFRQPEKPHPKRDRATLEQRTASALTRDEWKLYFSGHWAFAGARQGRKAGMLHEAMFPEELPRRLIRMFSFTGDTVLDPFLGSGTTAKVAADLGRVGMGYEINAEYLPLMESKAAPWPLHAEWQQALPPLSRIPAPNGYTPFTPDARPRLDAEKPDARPTFKVVAVVDEQTVRVDTGRSVSFLGVRVAPERAEAARSYLGRYLLGKCVRVTLPTPVSVPNAGYIRLTNGLFVNRRMIQMGLADPDESLAHPYRDRFLALRGVRS